MNNDSNYDVIYSYSRRQAIQEGVLVDVSEMAKEAGIRFPVALTSIIWNGYIVPNDNLASQGQSIEGRLWDTLLMFRCKAIKTEGPLLFFKVIFLMDKNKPETVILKSVCDGGDDGSPVITIMEPDED